MNQAKATFWLLALIFTATLSVITNTVAALPSTSCAGALAGTHWDSTFEVLNPGQKEALSRTFPEGAILVNLDNIPYLMGANALIVTREVAPIEPGGIKGNVDEREANFNSALFSGVYGSDQQMVVVRTVTGPIGDYSPGPPKGYWEGLRHEVGDPEKPAVASSYKFNIGSEPYIAGKNYTRILLFVSKNHLNKLPIDDGQYFIKDKGKMFEKPFENFLKNEFVAGLKKGGLAIVGTAETENGTRSITNFVGYEIQFTVVNEVGNPIQLVRGRLLKADGFEGEVEIEHEKFVQFHHSSIRNLVILGRPAEKK